MRFGQFRAAGGAGFGVSLSPYFVWKALPARAFARAVLHIHEKSFKQIKLFPVRLKGKTVRVAPLSAIYKGTHIIKSRTFTPSVRQGIAKLSALAQKCDSACARDYFNNLLRV